MILVLTFCQGEMSRLTLQLKLSRGRMTLNDIVNQDLDTRKGNHFFLLEYLFHNVGGGLISTYLLLTGFLLLHFPPYAVPFSPFGGGGIFYPYGGLYYA